MDARGNAGFFRYEIGLTDNPDFDKVTSLYADMFICSEYLHCTHEEFKRKPYKEKCKWYAFVEMKGRREEHDRVMQKNKQRLKEMEKTGSNTVYNKGRKKLMPVKGRR